MKQLNIHLRTVLSYVHKIKSHCPHVKCICYMTSLHNYYQENYK